MTALELKEYIYKNEKIEYILENLGCRNIVFHPFKDFYSATQPDVDADNPMGVIIKNCIQLNYYSYSRNIHIEEGKDIFNLIQDVKNLKFSEAIKYVHNLLGIEFKFFTKQEPVKRSRMSDILRKASRKKRSYDTREFKPMDENILTDFYPGIHIDLFREGIIKKTIDKFKLGYSYKWKRTIFPHYAWSTGELLGFNARTSIENYDLFDIKKYYLTPGLAKDINLYGLYQNMETIESKHVIVVGESEKNVLKRDSRGDSTWVALSGKHISDEQVRIIEGLDVFEIVIALDKDVPIEEVWSICDRFVNKRKVSYIWDKYDLLGEKDSPADACNKIYDYLYKHRIEYTEETHNQYMKVLNNDK